ncbi:MAG: hypothetical protein HY393_01220 [Candidatus Diapherotrites archaeon]|nr:hypothetical protein [Candidatus Diapherotrites archaeon]
MRVHAEAKGILVLVFLTGLFSFNSAAQTGGVYISDFRADPLGAQPESTITYYAVITNSTSAIQTVTLSLDLPAPESTTENVLDSSIAIPAYTTIEKTYEKAYAQPGLAPGKYTASLQLLDASTGTVLDSAQTQLAVVVPGVSIGIPETHPLAAIIIACMTLAMAGGLKAGTKR